MAILQAHLAPRPTFLARLNYGDNTNLEEIYVKMQSRFSA
jgi:hypothetical protein